VPEQGPVGQQRPSSHALRLAARQALRALDEPDDPYPIVAGWHQRMPDEQTSLMTQELMDACRPLEKHPALRLIAGCGHLAGYCAVVVDGTYGVTVAAFPYLRPPQRRTGGLGDLALFPPNGGGALIYGWGGQHMFVDEYPDPSIFNDLEDPPQFGLEYVWFQLGPPATVFEPVPPDCETDSIIGMGMAAEVYRSTLVCRRCNAKEPVKTPTLLRKLLQAIASGESEVRLGLAPAAVPSSDTRPMEAGVRSPAKAPKR